MPTRDLLSRCVRRRTFPAAADLGGTGLQIDRQSLVRHWVPYQLVHAKLAPVGFLRARSEKPSCEPDCSESICPPSVCAGPGSAGQNCSPTAPVGQRSDRQLHKPPRQHVRLGLAQTNVRWTSTLLISWLPMCQQPASSTSSGHSGAPARARRTQRRRISASP